WAGHPLNLPYVEQIESALIAVQRKFPGAQFEFFSGQVPKFQQLRFRHIPFNVKAEPEVIRQFDIGLLPLPDGSFAEGKSPIKGLQYMASGIPAVLSPRGATREMFHNEETGLFASELPDWERAIERLIRDPELARRLGTNARQAFEQHYSLSRTAPRLASLLAATIK